MPKRIEHIFDDNGQELKWCSGCKEYHSLNQFTKDNSSWDNLYKYCKLSEFQRQKIKQQNNPNYYNNYQAIKYTIDTNYRFKKQIRSLTNAAITRNELLRPDNCELCGYPSDRIQAHHISYDPKDILNVMFLCVACHISVHQQLKLENPMFEDDDIDQEETTDLVADNVIKLHHA